MLSYKKQSEDSLIVLNELQTIKLQWQQFQQNSIEESIERNKQNLDLKKQLINTSLSLKMSQEDLEKAKISIKESKNFSDKEILTQQMQEESWKKYEKEVQLKLQTKDIEKVYFGMGGIVVGIIVTIIMVSK